MSRRQCLWSLHFTHSMQWISSSTRIGIFERSISATTILASCSPGAIAPSCPASTHSKHSILPDTLPTSQMHDLWQSWPSGSADIRCFAWQITRETMFDLRTAKQFSGVSPLHSSAVPIVRAMGNSTKAYCSRLVGGACAVIRTTQPISSSHGLCARLAALHISYLGATSSSWLRCLYTELAGMKQDVETSTERSGMNIAKRYHIAWSQACISDHCVADCVLSALWT